MATLTLTDLCDAVDVTPRTVRYYIQQGLLAPAAGAGLAACYNAAHLRRLRVVKALQARHLPLAEIRARLEHLTEADERSLLGAAVPPPVPSSAADYIRAVLAGAPGLAGARPPATFLPPAVAHSGAGGVLAAPVFGARSAWDRHTVSKDIEIHVRRPLDLQTNRRLEKLLEAARALFKEYTNEP
ncbi:MAG: MerR family transcriptional regulator [Myxococcales bacterium]|nr:MerR family transcriptional regulator [Myxococcales bacterium]